MLSSVATIALALASTGTFAQTLTDFANPDLIRRGEYLAIAGDCVACHTAPGGKPFAGGLPLPTPIGAIIATNITPSKTAGIGNYTLAQFTDAMRKGVRADGAHLYPAMPYTAYAKVTDDDLIALYAYFMQAVAPVDAAPPDTSLPFPFNIRLLMLAWNTLFLDRDVFHADPARSADWNRGAYLARGLAHCGTCHTPRNLLMAEGASREMGGGEVGPGMHRMSPPTPTAASADGASRNWWTTCASDTPPPRHRQPAPWRRRSTRACAISPKGTCARSPFF